MKIEIERVTAVLVGKKLWRCTRAADLAAFQFGNRRPTKTFRGEPAEVGEFALHVQCGWRIVHGDKVLVARRDLYYPANYSSTNQAIPEDFNWDVSGANLQDKLVAELFQGGKREFAVRKIEVGCAGSLRILLETDMSLEVFPDDSHEQEHWRLFVARHWRASLRFHGKRYPGLTNPVRNPATEPFPGTRRACTGVISRETA